ncbi:unnamed protein product [Meloidogyne enterolobii]|uniref:Uncharacterized protein n=1 Tax=Meloidogyne enterolobii TaxID=390850 RepID=A0ACB0YZP3_MELEN
MISSLSRYVQPLQIYNFLNITLLLPPTLPTHVGFWTITFFPEFLKIQIKIHFVAHLILYRMIPSLFRYVQPLQLYNFSKQLSSTRLGVLIQREILTD